MVILSLEKPLAKIQFNCPAQLTTWIFLPVADFYVLFHDNDDILSLTDTQVNITLLWTYTHEIFLVDIKNL